MFLTGQTFTCKVLILFCSKDVLKMPLIIKEMRNYVPEAIPSGLLLKF